MSALDLDKQRYGTNLGPCDNGCRSAIRGTSKRSMVRSSATHKVTICGHPAGVVCPKCAEEMRKAWEGALG